MALYFYRAFARDGKKVSGFLDAPSPQVVKERLSQQGLFPTEITPAQEGQQNGWNWRALFARNITVKEKILFTKQLSVLLTAGVPLMQALELLLEQFEGALHAMLVKIKDDVKEGLSLADALKKYPKAFDTTYVQLVRAGEASGKLEVILNRLVNLLERQDAIAKRIRGAMMQPMIQLGLAILVVTGLMIFVVPQMVENFGDKKLPAATAILISMSNFMTSYWYILLGVIIAITMAMSAWLRTPQGKYQFDRIILRIPVIGHFARLGAVTQFCQTLGMLVDGGVNLAESLDIVCSIIDNRVLAHALQEARENIIKQGKIAQYLKQTQLFPPIAIYLIKTGEETGQLGPMLLTIADNQEKDLNELADNLSSLIAPIMLVVMGGMVLFIMMAIMQGLQQSE